MSVPVKIRFDSFELDPASGELRKSGILVKLQPQPFRVLLLLLDRAGQVVPREDIQRCLWTDSTFVDFDHGINFSINSIRRALGDTAEKPRYLETLAKRGYRFIGAVQQDLVPNHSSSAPGDQSGRNQAITEEYGIPETSSRESVETFFGPCAESKPPRWHLAISVGTALIVLECVALWAYLWKLRSRTVNLEEMRIARLTDSGKAEGVAISPNGEYVVYVLREGEERSLIVRQTTTGSELQILPPAVVELRALTFSPDGNYIFFLRTPKEAFVRFLLSNARAWRHAAGTDS
jgi:DNA-binding winged helix-turn-helix (wHTH) protein